MSACKAKGDMLALTAAAAAWKECMPEAAARAKAVIFDIEILVY